jgi:aspartyl-tRNA(Asn)/glutamyl-tRNA(Gln) amidotransferase subunit A
LTIPFSAVEAAKMIKTKKISAIELTTEAFSAIKNVELSVSACITTLENEALDRARVVQTRIDAGEAHSPLFGVPMMVKDNICVKGVAATCGSKMLGNFTPPYNASVYERLLEAGAILTAKTNLDEFAMGGSTETSYFGVTKNPWDVTRVAGGSSGGSAAAVASGETFYALGSDTGGSIRQPCSFCGVSGIKPTYGAVSRYGLIAYASSLDQIGPIGADIRDCAAVLSIITGKDPKDSTSVEQSAGLDEDLSSMIAETDPIDIAGMRVGIPADYFGDGLDNGVKAAVMNAAKILEGLGASLVDIKLPLVKYAVPAYYVIACAEASSNLSRYDGVKYGFSSGETENLDQLYVNTRGEGFGAEVKRRVMLGSFVLSSGYFDAYYKKGLQARELIQRDFFSAFELCDVILSPTAPTVAYKIGENISDPVKMYLGDIYTVSVNLAGLPAVVIPCGFSDDMPVGMQLTGRRFDEKTLIKTAWAFQKNTDFHVKRPSIWKEGVK